MCVIIIIIIIEKNPSIICIDSKSDYTVSVLHHNSSFYVVLQSRLVLFLLIYSPIYTLCTIASRNPALSIPPGLRVAVVSVVSRATCILRARIGGARKGKGGRRGVGGIIIINFPAPPFPCARPQYAHAKYVWPTRLFFFTEKTK